MREPGAEFSPFSTEGDLETQVRPSCFRLALNGAKSGLIGGAVVGAIEGAYEARQLRVRGALAGRIVLYGVGLESLAFATALGAYGGVRCVLSRVQGQPEMWHSVFAGAVGFGLRGAIVSRDPRTIMSNMLVGAVLWPIMESLDLVDSGE